MEKLVFNDSPDPTIGIEIELALVDAKTMQLSSSIEKVLERLPSEFGNSVKPELMQCYLEINTDVCHTVAEAEADLRKKLIAVERVTDELGLDLYWGSVHPFSSWRDQKITDNDRYYRLVDLLQDQARQLMCTGLHVHVGVDSGDKAIMLVDRLLRHLPTLLALSANSPWFDNRVTGLHSQRAKIMEGLPTAGLPTLMRNWSEYVWLVNHLIETGFINSIREIWWDIRPHHNFGTIEVRMCDMPGNLEDVMALTSLIQCLVKALSDDIDEGTYQHDCHPMMVRQNKWRACRFGVAAELVDAQTWKPVPVKEIVAELHDLLAPTAVQLQCEKYLSRVKDMAGTKGWARQQLDVLEQTGDAAEVVRHFNAISRVSNRSRPEVA